MSVHKSLSHHAALLPSAPALLQCHGYSNLLEPTLCVPPTAANAANGSNFAVSNSAKSCIRVEILVFCCFPDRGGSTHIQQLSRTEILLRYSSGQAYVSPSVRNEK